MNEIFNADFYFKEGMSNNDLRKKLLDKIKEIISNCKCEYIYSNGKYGTVLQEFCKYDISKVIPIDESVIMRSIGTINDVRVCVNMYMRWDDNVIYFNRGGETVYRLSLANELGCLVC